MDGMDEIRCMKMEYQYPISAVSGREPRRRERKKREFIIFVPPH
jgi:hypothetical protein